MPSNTATLNNQMKKTPNKGSYVLNLNLETRTVVTISGYSVNGNMKLQLLPLYFLDPQGETDYEWDMLDDLEC